MLDSGRAMKFVGPPRFSTAIRIMFAMLSRFVPFLLPSVVLSSVLEFSQHADDSLYDLSMPSNSTLTPAASKSVAPPSNVSISGHPLIICAKELGTGLLSRSCSDALDHISPQSIQRSFGKRGGSHLDVGLPARVLSCKLLVFSRLGEPLRLSLI